EQHKDDPNKAHIYFYSKIPFAKKSSDNTNTANYSKIDSNQIPAFEVKSLGKHGLAYCAPSVHKNGFHYEIIGTTDPVLLTAEVANGFMQHFDEMCKKHGLAYLENGDKRNESLTNKLKL